MPAETDPTVDYDVVVVGARCAGAPTAMLLARLGYRVLIVDRTVFPKDTMSSHYIHAYGVARLARWGLLDDLLATGCPPVRVLAGDWGDITLTGSPPPIDGVDFGVCPRRYVLDHLLNTAAVRSGADIEEGFAVTGLLSADGRVTGVRGRTRAGAETRITARWVVGADGMRSLVARTVGAPEYWTVPPLTVTYYTYFEGLPMDRLLIHWRTGRCVPAVPTHDGLTVVLSGWSYEGWREYRSDIRHHFYETVRTQSTPEFAERVGAARQVEPFVGTHHSANFFRKPYGPGWALVGDAGYHKDPVTALGMADAFRDSELLAAALDLTLSGREPAGDALGHYERRRNEESKPLYDYTLDLARYQPLTPERAGMLRALQADEVSRNRFFGVLAGSVRPQDFFSR